MESNPRAQRVIEQCHTQLRELHNESVRIAATIMSTAGADPVAVVDGAVFWTFANTGEHATITDAIRRVGAHPSVFKLVEAYHEVSLQMIATERLLAKVSSS